jgi:hypothetical protein
MAGDGRVKQIQTGASNGLADEAVPPPPGALTGSLKGGGGVVKQVSNGATNSSGFYPSVNWKKKKQLAG